MAPWAMPGTVSSTNRTTDVHEREPTVSNRVYTVRLAVLDLTREQWEGLSAYAYLGTAEEFLAAHGLPGGLSAKFNEEERAFFDEIYQLHRQA
jgi:hypothetical protein